MLYHCLQILHESKCTAWLIRCRLAWLFHAGTAQPASVLCSSQAKVPVSAHKPSPTGMLGDSHVGMCRNSCSALTISLYLLRQKPIISTYPINSKPANPCRKKQAHCRNSNVWCVGEFTRGAANAVQTILRTEGVRGLFAGYGSFMLRDLPFDAIEFVAYEQLKKSWVKYKGSDIRPHESAVIGELL